jgi:hypothetical protein
MSACESVIRPPAPRPWSARAEERRKRRGGRAQRRGRREQGECGEQHAPASEAIAQVPIQRRSDGRGNEVGDHDPGEIGEAAERLSDRGQRGGEDRLIDRRHEHRDHYAAEHRAERSARRRERSSMFHGSTMRLRG